MHSSQNVNRPDIFIAGAMRGGTSILHEFMAMDPEIHAGTKRAIDCFSLFEANGPDWYHAHFRNLPSGQHYLDASSSYFDMADGPRLPARIAAYNPDARVIMLAREPVARAVSHFNALRRANRVPVLRDLSADAFFSLDLEDAIGRADAHGQSLMQCLNYSLYHQKAQSYLNVFGDRFLVIDSEDLTRDPKETMERVFHHVGVAPIWHEAFGDRMSALRDSDAGLPLSAETIARLNRILGDNYAAFRALARLSAQPGPRAARPVALPRNALPAPDTPFKHAFVITYGHAGGTLVQELLNSVEGVCIRGENGGILAQLSQVATGLEKSQQLTASAEGPGSRWFGASGIHAASYIDQLYTDFRDQVLRPPPGTRILGFAETRHLMSDQQFTAYCDNLRERFPRALLIFNTRDNEHVIAANRGAAPVADDAVFARADDQFRSYAAAHPESCIEIRYDDYMVSNQALRPLFDRLGLPFDDEVIDRILARDRATLPEKHHKPGVIENEVLIGKDGWLFLWDGSNEVHRYYTDPDYFTDEDARNWADLLTTRRDRIEALGARYLHMTVPDKLSLLPEFVTLRLPHFDRRPTRLVASLLPGDGVNLDILPDLRKAAKQIPVFHRTDSHWTTAGCQAAYRRLCAVLGVEPQDFSDRETNARHQALDLGGKLTPPIMETPVFTEIRKKSRRVAENEAVRYNEQTGFPEGKPHFVGCYVHMQNDSPDARPETVLLFGNSFSEFRPSMLTAMLAETYRDLHFVWSTRLDFALIERLRPQIVISQIAERFMGTLPVDTFEASLD